MFADSVILMMKWNVAKTQFFVFMIEANIIFKEWMVVVFSLGTFDVQTMPCLQFIFAFHFSFSLSSLFLVVPWVLFLSDCYVHVSDGIIINSYSYK